MDPRIREGDKCGGGLTGTRASEAKGPFPGGKRVGSWGKKKRKKKKKEKKKKARGNHRWIYICRSIRKNKRELVFVIFLPRLGESECCQTNKKDDGWLDF